MPSVLRFPVAADQDPTDLPMGDRFTGTASALPPPPPVLLAEVQEVPAEPTSPVLPPPAVAEDSWWSEDQLTDTGTRGPVTEDPFEEGTLDHTPVAELEAEEVEVAFAPDASPAKNGNVAFMAVVAACALLLAVGVGTLGVIAFISQLPADPGDVQMVVAKPTPVAETTALSAVETPEESAPLEADVIAVATDVPTDAPVATEGDLAATDAAAPAPEPVKRKRAKKKAAPVTIEPARVQSTVSIPVAAPEPEAAPASEDEGTKKKGLFGKKKGK